MLDRINRMSIVITFFTVLLVMVTVGVLPALAVVPDQPTLTTATVLPKANVTLATAPATGITAWLAPAGTSTFTAGAGMTKLVGNGSSKTIIAPTTVGTYYLFYANVTGTSPASDGILTVKAAPVQPTLTSVAKVPGATVTLASAPAVGVNAWLAPSGTKTFAEGATMTTLEGDGTVKDIIAPTTEGNYYLYLVDSEVGTSIASTGILTVMAAATQPSIDAATVLPEATVTLAAAPKTGIAAWLAPASTTKFTAGLGMTQLVGNGSVKAIKAPKTPGTYYLYYVNLIGASDASEKALKVKALPIQPTLTSVAKVPGATVTLASAPAVGVNAWLAPSGTKTFAEGATMTTLEGDGTVKDIIAPTTEGNYYLYLVDSEVGASIASTGILTVMVAATQPSLTTATVLPAAIVTLAAAPKTGITVWLAPASTTKFTAGAGMTQLVGNSSTKTIKAPTTAGIYYLYNVNAIGASDASENALKVKALPIQPTLTAVTKVPGATVTLGSAPANGVSAWLAPIGTKTFAEGATMTTLEGDGTVKDIIAPTTEGNYYLYLVDSEVGASTASLGILTVMALPNQPTLAAATVAPKAIVTLAVAPKTGITAWLAPADTSTFTAGVTMTKLLGNGSTKTITAPTTVGSYYLYYVNAAGISNASENALTVE